jgi:phosphate-selective porin OprO/OprP
MFKKRMILFAVMLMLISLPLSAQDNDEKERFKVEWKDGFKLDSNDGNFKLKLGGRLQSDWMWGSAEDSTAEAFGEIVSGNEFRRARLFVSGTVYKVVEFKVQYDFAGGDVKIKDAYIGLKGLPFGTLRFGHYNEPFSLETQTSSKYITFLERSLPNVFVPGRNTGIGVLGSSDSQRMTWGLGVFTDADDYGNSKTHDDTYNLSGRVTFLPWLNGNDLLHVGVGLHHKGVNDGDDIRYRARPEVHLTHRFVDTGSFAASSANQIGLEAAGIFGRFSFQGEYINNMVSSEEYGDPSLQSGYLFGSVFLTSGDHRRYKKSSGAFDRTKPANPYKGNGGLGAIELVARYSWLDLSDADVFGGELTDLTLGINWYINNVTRLMVNYIHAERVDIGSAHYFQMRFQIDF